MTCLISDQELRAANKMILGGVVKFVMCCWNAGWSRAVHEPWAWLCVCPISASRVLSPIIFLRAGTRYLEIAKAMLIAVTDIVGMFFTSSRSTR